MKNIPDRGSDSKSLSELLLPSVFSLLCSDYRQYAANTEYGSFVNTPADVSNICPPTLNIISVSG